MSKNIFDFDEQLKIGDKGESDFVKCYSHLTPIKSKDRRWDFVLSSNSKTVELKTDTYDMGETPNFFMELISDMDKGSIGGPWRALQDNVDYFVYYFRRNKTFFWFEVKPLCDTLDAMVGTLPVKEIRNKGWKARGYAVPRDRLEKVLYKKEIF